jgi:lipoic acid synthetase
VHRLERLVIDTLADLGLPGCTSEGEFPGVWVGAAGERPRKIAAIGVRAKRVGPGRRRTLHGVAINVTTDLSMFDHIVPCGIADRRVTSLATEGIDVSIHDVADALAARAGIVFGDDGEVERADVVTGPAALHLVDGVGTVERPLLRRLRQAGVAPEDGLDIGQRKPEWVRVPVRIGKGYRQLGSTIHDLGLVTVCEEAGCPNIYECWADGTATFMINGERCTRACGFCQVDTRHPLPLAPDEPDRVAQAVARMRLGHAVVTCVARDDLPDGGAGAMAATIGAIRERSPGTTVEVLISDCRGDAASLDSIFAARPDVLNHNIETVARLQRAVRPSAGYARSLGVLARAGTAGLLTKSGLMVGLGETEDEVIATMADLRGVGVSIVTVGQYLRPSRDHLPVARYWAPEEFDRLRAAGAALGLAHVEASPLTRSSYHAREAVSQVQPAPLARSSS